MMRKNVLFPLYLPLYLLSILIILFLPHITHCAYYKAEIDTKYVRRDILKSGEKDLRNEYNPRLKLQYSYGLTEWTDLSAEGIFNYKREEKRLEEDIETREPQIELRLKSLIFNLKTGFKETWNRNRRENRAFAHFLIQPRILPEFKIDYDHYERETREKTDRLMLTTTYKPSKSFRIRFDLDHEYISNEPDPNKTENLDTESLNLTGEIEFERELSFRRPVKMLVSYKFESLYEERRDDVNVDYEDMVKKDKLVHTLKGKLSYKLTSKTNFSLEYENKTMVDDIKGGDNSDKDLQFNITQGISDWFKATGNIRKETKQEHRELNGTKDIKELTMEGQVDARLTDWFNLNFKAIDEETEQEDNNNITINKDRRIIEGNLSSVFPISLLKSQILNFKRTHENKEEGTWSEEEQFNFSWILEPIENLILEPEYTHTRIRNYEKEENDSLIIEATDEYTDEYIISIAYNLNINDYFYLDFSHRTGRKRTRTQKSRYLEINDDSSLEIEYAPFDSLSVISQITMKDHRIEKEKPNEELSYSLNFNWKFTPFIWSTTYKYNDKKHQSDTENFKSKLIYNISDYMIEGEYNFNQIFMPQKEKEDVITLRLKVAF